MTVGGGPHRTLIVNADDFGLTAGVCAAVLEAHERGIVTSTSALVVAPAWDGNAASLASSGMGVGAHLCAVGEDPPLLAAREIPTLVDADGRFPATWRKFLSRSARGRVDPDDLRREFAAQIEKLRQAGIRPTHVDSHQNLHLWPQVAGVIVGIARAEAIGAARVPRTSSMSVEAMGVRLLGARFDRRARRCGVRTPQRSAGLDEAGRLSLPNLLAALDRLGAGPGGFVELATHPGHADDPDRDRYRWGYRWAEEFEALCHPAARAAVRRCGFVLGDFGDLVGTGAAAGASS